MDIKQLQALGAFVPQKLHKRVIQVERPVLAPQDSWADPDVPEYTGENVRDEMTVHIRLGSSADEIEMSQASNRERPFVAIHRFIYTEDGKPVFESVEQAMTLKSWLVIPLFNAIAGVTHTLPKASRRKTSSGSKSRSLSADAAPRNGSTQSTRVGA